MTKTKTVMETLSRHFDVSDGGVLFGGFRFPLNVHGQPGGPGSHVRVTVIDSSDWPEPVRETPWERGERRSMDSSVSETGRELVSRLREVLGPLGLEVE